jgi:DNA-3-methyladenine glycosylase II
MNDTQSFFSLNDESHMQGIAELNSRDKYLSSALSRWGSPPFWTHPNGFPGLVIAILSQQVSLESAQAAYSKLENSIDRVSPEEFLRLDNDELLGIGFSRQKASYVQGIAQKILNGDIHLEELEELDDDIVRTRLITLRGVGPWTAGTYLLFALRRSDAWPSGDLALEKAVQDLKGLSEKPGTEEVDKIAEAWRPWRAVGARILWHYYLNERGRNLSA